MSLRIYSPVPQIVDFDAGVPLGPYRGVAYTIKPRLNRADPVSEIGTINLGLAGAVVSHTTGNSFSAGIPVEGPAFDDDITLYHIAGNVRAVDGRLSSMVWFGRYDAVEVSSVLTAQTLLIGAAPLACTSQVLLASGQGSLATANGADACSINAVIGLAPSDDNHLAQFVVAGGVYNGNSKTVATQVFGSLSVRRYASQIGYFNPYA